MATAALLGRLALALTFAAAAIGKAADRDGSREALRAFGLGGSAERFLVTAVPLAEIVTAIALLPAGTAPYAAAAATVLLGSFAVGIARALARGTEADCHCFGKLHSAPIRRTTLARTLALMVLALFVTV